MPQKGDRVPLYQRLINHSAKLSNGCLIWTGVKSRKGYGVLKYEGGRQQAHRISWIAFYGSIPNDMCVLHRCDNPACFNINHLFLGTRGDNNRDRHAKGRSRNQHTGRIMAYDPSKQGDCRFGVGAGIPQRPMEQTIDVSRLPPLDMGLDEFKGRV